MQSGCPISLYMDAVPYSHTDSVLAVWAQCLVTGARFCLGVLRKRTPCKCGCRGWCSFNELFMFLRWSLLALARGIFPPTRHDGKPWASADAVRCGTAGKYLPCRAAVVFIKGDWAEYSATLGFPNHADGLRPCFRCVAFGDDRFDYLGH